EAGPHRVDISFRDRSGQVLVQDVLESEEHTLRPVAAATLEVGVDTGRVWRILTPMPDLVTVGLPDDGRAWHAHAHSLVIATTRGFWFLGVRRPLRFLQLWALGSGLWTLGSGLWALGSGLWESQSR